MIACLLAYYTTVHWSVVHVIRTYAYPTYNLVGLGFLLCMGQDLACLVSNGGDWTRVCELLPQLY